jgi:bifunctional aspartokinase / homoserine dehydrogenase 1
MIVLKFGGTSVGTPKRIQEVVAILKSYQERGEKFTVVFSAFTKVTDALIEMSELAAKGDDNFLKVFEGVRQRHTDAADFLLDAASKEIVLPTLLKNLEDLKNLLQGIYLVREASLRTMDYVLSFGERNSSLLIAQVMEQNGIPAEYLDARDIIKTDKNFGSARVDFATTNDNISQYYAAHASKVQVVTGFIGSTKTNITTTLGRGGSDYTAAIVGAALNASAIEIWTDVDGVLTCDPRKVKKAFTIPTLTFAEAMEMSHFGAKVIYPPTIQPALAKNIPLVIKNTFNPSFVGTVVHNKRQPHDFTITGISSINNIALVTLQGSGLFGVPGIAGRLFGALARANVNIILITQGSSEHSITFAVQPQDAAKAKRKVEEEFETEIKASGVDAVRVESDLSVVAIIGENMRYSPGIAGKLFQALGRNGINISAIAQGSSELNISVVVNRADEMKALNAIHEAFFLSDTQALHLFVMGVGLIGKTLLKQIRQQQTYLREKAQMEIKVIGLSNSRKMVFNDDDGIDLDNWEKLLAESGETASPTQFVARMKAMNFSNAIFVDNTASEEIAKYYEGILDESISISTPNKIATSSSYENYKKLKALAAKRGVLFQYETNVGAGLPVISTLNNLMSSGDRILKIEGVLSGSVSFIFNSFAAGKRFSDIVKKAKQLGYTEPDPRIDLNGIDARRKLIILARETGLPMEAKDVSIENFLPQACQDAQTIDELFVALENSDEYFEQMRATAAKQKKVLRVLCSVENGKAAIKMVQVGTDSPFYNLSGSDNMIVFTTERYKERPLVIRGPGAGAEVTAAGVLAEVIAIGNYLM